MKRSAINSWGPGAWTLLHTISFTYPVTPSIKERQNMYTFLMSFATVIPCVRCRTDFTDLLQSSLGKSGSSSAHLKSRDAFSKFMVDVHNSVNRRLKYKEVDYATVKRWYTQDSSTHTMIICVICIVVVCLIIVGMFKPATTSISQPRQTKQKTHHDNLAPTTVQRARK